MLYRAERLGLLLAMAVTSVLIWTGAPLAGIWVGSQVQGEGPPKMEAFAVAAITILVLVLLLVRLLSVLGGTYDMLTGRKTTVRRHVPWLRSMRAERPHENAPGHQVSALDRILIAVVI